MKRIYSRVAAAFLTLGTCALHAAPPDAGKAKGAPAAGGSYVVTTLKVPDAMEVGGMDWMPDGRMMVCTRRGEVWSFKDGQWKLFASGLQEALGLLHGDHGNDVYVMQRPELTHLTDTTGTGVADKYETVCAAFGFSGNYHEFAYGPVRDKEGNFYCSLNLAHAPDNWGGAFMGAHAESPYRGWVIKITPQGKMIPYADGLRSPNGIAKSPDGDIILTDNQGEYVAASYIYQLREGAFYGHPSSLIFDPVHKLDPKKTSIGELDKLRTIPLVIPPYGRMGQSISQPAWDTTAGKFGPYAGQMFVGDVQIPIIMRVTFEKVGDGTQGACYPFIKDEKIQGVNRLLFGPDGSLYVGITDRGWVRGSEGIAKITWDGKPPMDIAEMKLTEQGFDLIFTKPVDPATASSESVYNLSHFHYEYHKQYGSGEMGTTPAKIKDVKVSPDGKRVSLIVADLVPKTIYELHLNGVQGADGEAMRNNTAYYTLNQLKK